MMANNPIEYTSHKHGDEDPRIRQAIESLGDFNDARRSQARNTLVHIGKPAIPGLVKTLEHANHLVRWGAAKALAEIGDPSTAGALVKVLEDDVFDIRWIAAEGLIGMGILGLEPLLRALIEHADIASLRESARHIIHGLSEIGLCSLVTPVLIALEEFEPEVAVPPAAQLVLNNLKEMKHHP